MYRSLFWISLDDALFSLNCRALSSEDHLAPDSITQIFARVASKLSCIRSANLASSVASKLQA